VACSNVRLWKLDTQKNKETRLDAFEMKGLRKILLFSWTAKKTNEWVLNKAGVKRELHGERDSSRNNVRCKQAMKTTHDRNGQHQYMDRTPKWKSQSEWQRTEINGETSSMVWPTLGSRMAKNRTEQNSVMLVENDTGQKLPTFNLPHLHLAPPFRVNSRWNFAAIFGDRKLESLGYCTTLITWSYVWPFW